MLRVALTRVRYQFGSLLLVSLAVAAAVAFIAASFTLGDAIRTAVYRETAAQAEHVAARATSNEKRFSDADVRKVASLPGVTAVQPRIDFGTIALAEPDGTVVRVPGEPTLTAFVAPVDPDLSDRKLVTGAYPRKPGELVVPEKLAKDRGWKPGTHVDVLDTARGKHDFTITGVVEGSTADGAAGLLPADFSTLLQRPDERGWYALDVKGTVTPQAVRDALHTTVISGSEYADELATTELGGSITDIIRGLKLFAWVAVVVALAVAYNAFGIVLAQRQREVALVRCVGARRGQVFRASILEAAVVGVVAAVGGYAGGQALATAAAYGARAAGIAPDSLTVTFSPTAAVVALIVGVSVSVLAAIMPAWSATRVAPVRALSDQPELIEDKRIGWVRSGVGVLLVVLGAGLAWYSADRGDSWAGIGGGFLVMLALLALGPVVVGPLVRVVGFPGRVTGAAGRLAAANGARHPRRTAAVTNALTIGIGLATVMLVGFASLEKTANAELTAGYPADYTLTSVAAGSDPVIPASLVRTLDRPELEKPVPIRSQDVESIVAPRGTVGVTATALDPAALRAHLPSKFVESGDLNAFGPGQVVVTSKVATEQLGGLTAGDTVRVGSKTLRVAVIVTGGYDSPFGPVTFDPADLAGAPTGVLLWKKPGVDASDARAAIDSTLVDLPDVEVSDLAGTLAELRSEINGYLAAGGLLIGMAMIVAILGVMITLTLSVLERRREIAVLRALGLTRGQLYATLTLEGAIMALLAAVLGSALGVGLGIAGTFAAFGSQDDLLIGVPVEKIGFVLLGAAVIGVLAALPPARRASRTAPVEALATA
ncbi:FtsX-like permease family protein [Cryptosporangium phraense]|uniref:FtsX-like permease family protein n=1 Tax=Cryptosporangium phraense TaxID=2593070 RepID=A0A545AGM9_9ACTN|nr:FtsX-like permease family protein [Cryptosporangium phraense]TQS40471.1 FtsX-like permease family protein [Cryptosporangium phraense]